VLLILNQFIIFNEASSTMKTMNSYYLGGGHAQNYDCLDEEGVNKNNALPASTTRVHSTQHSPAINRTNARTCSCFKNKTIRAAVAKAIDALKVGTAQKRAPARAEDEEPALAAAHLRDTNGVKNTAEAPAATNNNTTYKHSVLNEVLVQNVSTQQQGEHAVLNQATISISASSDNIASSTRQTRSEAVSRYIRPTRVLVQSKCTGMTYSVPQSLLEQVAEDRKQGRPIKKFSSIEDLYHAGIVPSGYNDNDSSDGSSDGSSDSSSSSCHSDGNHQYEIIIDNDNTRHSTVNIRISGRYT
jgi:hypothetical protein